MSQEEKIPKFAALRSLFMDGSIKRMKDIEELYPTNIAISLGFNHSRYIKRLYKPDDFTIKEIISFAELIGVPPKIVTDIILNQLSADKKKKNPLSDTVRFLRLNKYRGGHPLISVTAGSRRE